MNVNCEVFYFSTMPGFKILGNETQMSRNAQLYSELVN